MHKGTISTHYLLILFVAMISLFPIIAHADEALHIETTIDLEVFDEWMAKGEQLDVHFAEDDIMSIVASTYAIRNDQVDIFVINAYNGLYTMKSKKYYWPLQNSSTLYETYQQLYPAFQKMLMDGDNIVGWILYAQPLVRNEPTDILSVNGIASPVTFDEFLNVCEELRTDDLLGSEYVLTDVIPYTKKGMLDFYMEQYIQACQMNSGSIDFTNEDFLNTVGRIKAELPQERQRRSGEMNQWPVFSMPAAFDHITTRMKFMPKVLDDQDSAIEVYVAIAVINPYSKNIDKAISFLEYCAERTSLNAYFYRSDMKEPMLNDSVVAAIEESNKELESLSQYSEIAAEQKDRISELKNIISNYENRRYIVSDADIAYYQTMIDYLYIDEGSPIGYDSALKSIVDRYLQSSMTEQEFGSQCQEYINRIYDEM